MQTRLKELQNENKYTKERLKQAEEDVKKVRIVLETMKVHLHLKIN